MHFVSIFTVDKQHVYGAKNCADDALFRIYQLRSASTPSVDLDEMKQARVMHPDIHQLRQDNSLDLTALPSTTSQNTTLRDV